MTSVCTLLAKQSFANTHYQVELGSEQIEFLMKTETMEEAYTLLAQYPDLLTDQADILLSSIIHAARQQGHENTALALDERRDFLREVRQEQEESNGKLTH